MVGHVGGLAHPVNGDDRPASGAEDDGAGAADSGDALKGGGAGGGHRDSMRPRSDTVKEFVGFFCTLCAPF